MDSSVILYILPMVFPLIIFALIIRAILVRAIPLKKLQRIQQDFVEEANNQNVEEYISILQSMKSIPNELTIWESLRAAYQLVLESDKVDVEVKERLRKTMLGKGVNRLQPVRQNHKKTK